MKHGIVLLALLLLSGMTAAQSAKAQNGSDIVLGLSLGTATVHDAPEAPSGSALHGFLIGADLVLRHWKLVLQTQYLEGIIAGEGGSYRRPLAQAELLAGVQPARWLALLGGPLMRGHGLPDGVARSVTWQTRVRLELAAIRGLARTQVDVWRVLGGRVYGAEGIAEGWGGQAALSISPSRGGWWARIAYRHDRSDFGLLRVETFEQLVVTLGMRVF